MCQRACPHNRIRFDPQTHHRHRRRSHQRRAFSSFPRLWHSDRYFNPGHSFSRSSAGRAPKRRTFDRGALSRGELPDRQYLDNSPSSGTLPIRSPPRHDRPASTATSYSPLSHFSFFSRFSYFPHFISLRKAKPAACGCCAFAPPTFPARRSACIKGT